MHANMATIPLNLACGCALRLYDCSRLRLYLASNNQLIREKNLLPNKHADEIFHGKKQLEPSAPMPLDVKYRIRMKLHSLGVRKSQSYFKLFFRPWEDFCGTSKSGTPWFPFR